MTSLGNVRCPCAACWTRGLHPSVGEKPPKCSAFGESGRRGSNPRPLAWEANALPAELRPPEAPTIPMAQRGDGSVEERVVAGFLTWPGPEMHQGGRRTAALRSGNPSPSPRPPDGILSVPRDSERRRRWQRQRSRRSPARSSRPARASSPPTRARGRSRSASKASTSSRPRTTAATTGRCSSPPRALREYISGVILFDETIRQQAADGTPLREGAARTRASCPASRSTRAPSELAGAPEREGHRGPRRAARATRASTAALGARFAKWRAVITIGGRQAQRHCLDANAHALARYAALCAGGRDRPDRRARGPDGRRATPSSAATR